jgi:hypothetical protein
MRSWTFAVSLVALALGCGGGSPSSKARAERDTTGAEAAASETRATEGGVASAAEGASSTERSSAPSTSTSEAPTNETAANETSSRDTSATGAALTTGEAPAQSLPAQVQPVDASIRANIEILERQTRELEEVASTVAGIRPLVTVGPSGVPPICTDRAPLEGLRMVGTSGSAGASAALGALGALEDYCGPFDRWTSPTDREAERVLGYLQLVDRIMGWMRDIERCSGTTGAERARCENAYSDVQREAAEEAARALALLDAHQRELRLVRTAAARFPCTTPTLERIAAVTWTGSVARAQLGGLSRAAEEVCRTLGVEARSQREALRRVSIALDRAESSARAQRRSSLEAIDALRPYAP